MSALTEGRSTSEMYGKHYDFVVKNGVTVFVGGMVAVNSDALAVPASDTAGLVVYGKAETTVVGDGVKRVKISRGCYMYENDTANPLTVADYGKQCYILDDQTVTKTVGNGVIAGKFLYFNDGKPVVEIPGCPITTVTVTNTTEVESDGLSVDYLSASGNSADDVVEEGNLFGVVEADITAGETGKLKVEGEVDLPKEATTDTFDVGDKVYWDATAEQVTSTPGTLVNSGVVLADADATDTTVKVLIG